MIKSASRITPEMLAKSDTEGGHQAAVFCYFQQNIDKYPETRLLFAIPNGGLRDKITAAKLKATGVKAGVPDMMLPIARSYFHGLYVELKKDHKQKESEEQKKWLNNLRNEGYACYVCFGWEDAVKAIIRYLEGKHERTSCGA